MVVGTTAHPCRGTQRRVEIVIFVAGKTGQVALSLKEEATERGIDLHTYGRPDFDLGESEAIHEFVAQKRPSAIINAAAYTAVDNAEDDEDTAYSINAIAAGKLAQSARTLGVPFIHISTDYVFDGEKQTPYTEGDTPNPTGAYGRTKLAGEKLVMDANPNAVIMRTAWVYSPFGKNFLKTMINLAGRDSLGVVADQFGNPTYAPDIARGILDCLQFINSAKDNSVGGIYHMTGSGSASWHEFAETVFDIAGKYGLGKPTVNAITTADYPTPAKRPASSRLNCTKLYETFGVKLPEWQSSTADCIKRLSENGGLG